ncbi:MAG: acyl-CoA dehydrogenase family protein [Actinomycetota bacterium]
MDFRLSEDQLSLQKGAREFLQKECTSAVVRAAFESENGDSPELYRKMADLGWLALTVPEEHGGLGLGAVEHAVLLEQLGYFNAPGSFFGTSALAIPILLHAGAFDECASATDGSRRFAVVLDPSFVLDAGLADAFIVVDEEVSLIDASDADVQPHATIDGTRRTGTVRFDAAKARKLGSARGIQAIIDRATAALAAECVGGMQWALDTTVGYAKVRAQFGRPIGSFQAVKHRLAEALLRTESSRSAAYYAAWANAASAPDAAYSSSVAKAYVSEAHPWVTGEAIQLHGGIGFTWEHDAHLYFKRAMMNQVLLNDAEYHRERALMMVLPGSDREEL